MVASALFFAGCYAPDLGSSGTVGLFCHPDDSPACPDGSTCMVQPNGADYRCVTTSGTMTGGGSIPKIPKTSTVTPVADPMLNTSADCPDNALEPNDSLSAARTFNITPDSASTPKLVNLAICPKGANDIDVFAIPVPGSYSLYAQLFYDVSYGDLDVAILDNNGNMVSYDGSAVSNACTTTQASSGTYYVVIQGANGQVNRYDAKIALYSSAHPCQ